MNLALYGGTFDPVHHGHLILARHAAEQLSLDRVFFIPARLSPHKLHHTSAPPHLREAMLLAALADEPLFTLDPHELHSPGPNFAFDTAIRYQQQFPHARLFYFIGEDHLPLLSTWRKIDELLQLVQFVVFTRSHYPLPPTHAFPQIHRQIDISATDIRTRVAHGASIRYLLPEYVRNLIHQHQLYQNSTD
ncbi:MAG: nicotinate-nucleotide adenylyltransferase [Verrucomicrobiota bacterium]